MDITADPDIALSLSDLEIALDGCGRWGDTFLRLVAALVVQADLGPVQLNGHDVRDKDPEVLEERLTHAASHLRGCDQGPRQASLQQKSVPRSKRHSLSAL